MLGDFGAVLLTSNILGAGQSYVFTFESGELLFLGSTSTIKDGLAERMANYGEVISVSRGLFSDRYIVTVVPTGSVSLSDWLSAFDVSWRDLGYNNITFVQAEGGLVSTQAGGVLEITQKAGEEILAPLGGAVASGLKPFLPYILAVAGVYFLIVLSPRLMSRGKGE
jgi:hypothetical protein